MALDLYVNFERHSNNSTFYRIIDPSTTSKPFVVKVVDLRSIEKLGDIYNAKYSLNNSPYVTMDVDESGQMFSILNFDTSRECLCSINVKVFENQTVIKEFFMQGIFLSSFPSVDFILYPSRKLDYFTSLLVEIDSENYQKDSPGPLFIGEGHTETFNLSCLLSSSGNAFATWYVGNSGSMGFNSSVIPVVNNSATTATVEISSILNDQRSYPVSIKVNTDKIAQNGPIITYDDVTGEPRYYPFFASSLDSFGNDINKRLKGNIKVLLYPDSNAPTFIPPFSSTHFRLPLNHSFQTFRSIIYNPRNTNFLTENFLGTEWEIKATSDIGEWSISTPFLSSILAYQFKLGYDFTENDYMLPTFTASSVVPTVMTVNVSSYKELFLNTFPNDWQRKRVHYENTAKTIIGPMPFFKLYIPNFYYLRGQEVPITIVEAPIEPFNLISLLLESNAASAPLLITAATLSGTMIFERTGPVQLSATATLFNPNNNSEQITSIIYNDTIEIVPSFDVVNEKYFLTSLTPFELTYNTQPKLSPNEWAIADNVNSILEKIYTTIEDLNKYTILYQKTNKLYAWIGPSLRTPQEKFQETLASEQFPVNIWADLECNESNTEDEKNATWAAFECKQKTTKYTWEYHYCEGGQEKIDPTCLQRHCLDWRWKSRKQGAGSFNVTWKQTKKGRSLQKRWSYERCEYDSEILNCNRDTWKISTIDPLYYPIPSSYSVSRCLIIDVEFYPKTEQIIIAHPTEISLIDNDYSGTNIARKGIADETFTFQNIVGMGITSEGKVVTLDGTLCRISVFDISTDPQQFKLFNAWGTYGTAENPRGFNKPQDIHIDQYDSVWITDTGNKRIKKLSILGKHTLTIYHKDFEITPPLSVCVDSKLNVHCLVTDGVLVFDQYANYLFKYYFPAEIYDVKKINVSYNREMIYVSYEAGIAKYFRTGLLAYYLLNDIICGDSIALKGFKSVSQDKYRNLYLSVGDKIIKSPDLQQIIELKAKTPTDIYWSLEELKIHKEEYIQPWVYLKAFHRLWDNIEIMRNALSYEPTGCKSYTKPKFKKEDLVIGQNEIVTNAVINRLSEQLWANLSSLFKYFDPNCKK